MVTATPLYTERSGHGPPLALLHGWCMNLRVFDALRSALSDTFAVTAIDLPGHGHSAEGALDAESQLQRLGQVLPRAAVVIGWSLGGQFALQLAARSELEVRALCLVSTTPKFVAASDWPNGMAASTLERFAHALQSDPQRTVGEFLELQVRGSADGARVLQTLTAALRSHGAATAAALSEDLQLLQHNDLRSLTRTLTLPALVISGQYDRVTPPQAGEALAQLLPGAHSCVLPRAGHAPFLSHPQQLLERLRAWLQTLMTLPA